MSDSVHARYLPTEQCDDQSILTSSRNDQSDTSQSHQRTTRLSGGYLESRFLFLETGTVIFKGGVTIGSASLSKMLSLCKTLSIPDLQRMVIEIDIAKKHSRKETHSKQSYKTRYQSSILNRFPNRIAENYKRVRTQVPKEDSTRSIPTLKSGPISIDLSKQSKAKAKREKVIGSVRQHQMTKMVPKPFKFFFLLLTLRQSGDTDDELF